MYSHHLFQEKKKPPSYIFSSFEFHLLIKYIRYCLLLTHGMMPINRKLLFKTHFFKPLISRCWNKLYYNITVYKSYLHSSNEMQKMFKILISFTEKEESPVMVSSQIYPSLWTNEVHGIRKKNVKIPVKPRSLYISYRLLLMT